MAVPHFSVSIVARGSGRSAVLSAAYRHCAKMDYEREARTIDYTRKQGLLHEEFVVPVDAPEWLQSMIADRSVLGASEAFWNKVEYFEKRSDAQFAKDVTIALPIELSAEQNVELVRDFVARHITAQGMVADWVFHDAPGNPHIHLMTTLRPLTEDGFGSKKVAVTGPDGQPLRNDAGKIVYELWAGGLADFNALRDGWFACQNRHLALAGLDIRVDGRSFEKQGIELTPTIHLGVGAKAIERKADEKGEAAALERLELQEERRAENARKIQRNPEIVLDLITREMSVFDERDVAKILHRYIDDVGQFQSLMARLLQSPDTLRLDRERVDFTTGVRAPAKYTTRELIRLEAEMANRAIWLSQRSSHGVRNAVLEATFARHDRLPGEQKTAIEHVTGAARIATVIGRAGAGKTTMMKAAREAWEAAGYRVVGAALAGKAAEGLEKEAEIPSRTLSSWELCWNQGRGQLDDKTIFVLDEAGMVSSRQMALFVETVTRSGAKLVLVGDPEQLQPIEAGAAFRAIAERIGYAELETIYRQNEQWMRDASLDLARGNVGKAVEAYEANGKLNGAELKADAATNLISDWNRDYDPNKSTLILAHLRRDVRMLNELARAKLIERGIIDPGFAFKTTDGVRGFAAGDQIVFLKNEGSIGVKNGMLGKVVEAAPGRIVVTIGEGEHLRQVSVEQRLYNNVDYGYATTVHKSQGATVDRVKMLASLSLDRHLTYVAMTRHREDLGVYYGRRSFAKAGGLVEMLSRKNSKETTLDYAGGNIYRQALRFAETRGLHLVNVARTVARDRLEWTVRQSSRLLDLAGRLAAIGARLGFATSTSSTVLRPAKEAKPMVSGITTFPKSVGQAVEDKIAGDPALKKQWEEVSMRFHHVYAQPESAFKAVDVDAMLRDQSAAATTLAKITSEPETFGTLKGKTGLLASRTDRSDREQALKNVTPLADSISDYLRQRGAAERRNHAEELAVRRQVALVIPALSSNAKSVLERVRDAIDRKDLPSGLEYALADKMVKAELEGFAKAVSERFGERTFLPLAAKEANGEAFQRVTAGMNAAQKSEVQQAWNTMRTVQQLSAHERSVTALKQAETLRQTRSQGLTLI
ncbi:Ti-type conjugative transfer relaxase TraA [Rhizobium azooxidifex]|uniref:Ti-type conjugative transfer relaxase TraA n=1 Tax=Mycoplana azooxidifex TaxID=1636188 RepID=A0A7W6DH90_9HYPH|nr:Ti-type conjugative transfer relaxase TraA [Mycoplana azooxidifex]MBB3979768.1 Ti-type conjugative transfer relaxase TraA [Mycoplana azooxidifex]